MARPNKEGLEYFPLDTKFDDEIQLIDGRFGCAGLGVLIKLWQIIYSNGYYIDWTERESLLYKPRINADTKVITDVINECLKWGIFDNELYQKYSILTSKGIQKRFIEATQRRKENEFIKEYLLIKNVRDLYGKKDKDGNLRVSVSIISINVDNNSRNVSKSTQTETETETEIETEREEVEAALTLLGIRNNVLLNDIDHANLSALYENPLKLIDKISLFLANASKPYKDHYALLLKIAEEDGWPKRKKQPEQVEEVTKPEPMPAEIRAKIDFLKKV